MWYWLLISLISSLFRISIRDLLIECFHQRISQLSTWTQEIMIHGELPMQYFTLCWQWGVEREFKAWTISPPCHQIIMQALHIAISPSSPYRYITKFSISLYHQALHIAISPSSPYRYITKPSISLYHQALHITVFWCLGCVQMLCLCNVFTSI